MENAKQVIEEITKSVSQKSASRKDEVSVMKAIMNDPNYSVDVYDKDGKIGECTPGKDFRRVVTNAVSAVTHISNKEAAELMDGYEFNKSDAAAMVSMSKEFINSYLQTGRKLPLGGRITSNVELMWKEVAERDTEIPTRDGGERSKKLVPAHGGIKASNPCPAWVVKK